MVDDSVRVALQGDVSDEGEMWPIVCDCAQHGN